MKNKLLEYDACLDSFYFIGDWNTRKVKNYYRRGRFWQTSAYRIPLVDIIMNKLE